MVILDLPIFSVDIGLDLVHFDLGLIAGDVAVCNGSRSDVLGRKDRGDGARLVVVGMTLVERRLAQCQNRQDEEREDVL